MRNELILLLSFFILFSLLVHSFIFRGRYLTIAFFILVFFWGYTKEFLGPSFPYSFSNITGIDYLLNKAMVIIGWAITFYLSWCISETILIRIGKHKENIFSTLLLSCFVIASIAYFMESAAANIGWWQWDMRKIGLHPTSIFTTYFFVGTSLKVIEAWVYFGLIFLFSYFFIFLKPHKYKGWKYIFCAIPFISIWLLKRLGLFTELFFLIAFLSIFIFSRHTKLVHPQVKIPMVILKTKRIFEYIPVFVLAFMMLTVTYCLVFIKHMTYPLISLLPALFLLLYAIKKIHQLAIFLILIPLAILAKEKMVPLLCLMFLIAGLQYEKLLHLFKKIRQSR